MIYLKTPSKTPADFFLQDVRKHRNIKHLALINFLRRNDLNFLVNLLARQQIMQIRTF